MFARIRTSVSNDLFLCKRRRLIHVVLRKPAWLPPADRVVYILKAKYAIIFLHSQNVEMIAAGCPESSPSFCITQLETHWFI